MEFAGFTPSFITFPEGFAIELSQFRLLRMVRLVRVLRLLRVVRFCSDLRIMVNGILGSAVDEIGAGGEEETDVSNDKRALGLVV